MGRRALSRLFLVLFLGTVWPPLGQLQAEDPVDNLSSAPDEVEVEASDGELESGLFSLVQDSNVVRPPTGRGTDATRSQVLSRQSTRRRGARRSFARLARAPDMFGDTFGSLTVTAMTGFDFVVSDLPLGGGNRRVKVAEHNRAQPTDRVYFLYHHFHNAFRVDRSPAMGVPTFISIGSPLDQYTVGAEKTFDCGSWSIEVRMPFVNDYEIRSASPAMPMTPDFNLFGGDIGNLSVILKGLLFSSCDAAVSAGLGINTPTGSSVTGALPVAAPAVTFSVRNDAVHLQPFVAMTATPTEDLFMHAFGQIDIAANGNRVSAMDGMGAVDGGVVQDQTLAYFDIGAGYWLRRDDCAAYFTGLAAIAEFHYTTSLQDADTVPLLGGALDFGNAMGRFDVVNLTLGLHAEVTPETSARVGTVFPMFSDDNRFFDSEVQVSLIHRF